MSFGHGEGPGWGPGAPQTPDWSALASDAERKRSRKRWLAIAGGALATVAVGTVVALAIVSQSAGGDGSAADDGASSSLPDPSDLPSDTTEPEPTFSEISLPPLPKPSEFITDAEKDTAPFEADGFYAGNSMDMAGRLYTEAATAEHADCAGAATDALAAVLRRHGCGKLLRATYTGEGAVVTVGVAQFGTAGDALAAREASTPHLLPLIAGETPAFCRRGGCRTTANQVGRYAYFTIAGNSDGSPDSTGDGTPAQQAARDGNDRAYELIRRRGEVQASASASALVEERESRRGN